MGNSTFHPIVAFLRYKRKNEEVTTLTNVITTPDYYVILTRTSLLLAFLAKARLFISAWFPQAAVHLNRMCLLHTRKLQIQKTLSMMKQLYLLTTKRCGIFLALLLLMALPMAGQDFQSGQLWYRVTDATNKHVSVTKPQGTNPANSYAQTLSGAITIPQTVTDNNSQQWTVTEIDENAFNAVYGITDVTLPATVMVIGKSAFMHTTNLESINFPAALSYIGVSAFDGSGLTKADIPGKTFIATTAFQGCKNLAQLSIPHVTCLGVNSFAQCTSLTSVTVPASARLQEKVSPNVQNAPSEESGKNAFFGCSELKEVTIEDGVQNIAGGMFSGCRSIAKMELPASLNYIREGAFSCCRSLESINMPGVTTIELSAFSLCGLKGDLVISSTVKTIGGDAFSNNDGLTGFTWKGEEGCALGAGNFDGCINLEFIDLHTLDNPSIENPELNRKGFDNLFGGLPTHTVVYLPKGKAFTFAEGEDVNFVKADNTCTLLSVQDGADYEFPNAFKAMQAVYNKYNATVSNGTNEYWDDYVVEFPTLDSDNSLTTYRDFSGISNGKNCFTMLLPYAIKKRPSGIRAYELHLKDNYNPPVQGEKEYTQYYLFRSIPDERVLEANKPYLLRIIDGQVHTSKEFGATNVEIAASGTDKIDDNGQKVAQQNPTSTLYNNNVNGTLKPQGYQANQATKPNQEFFFVGGTERLNNHLAVNLHTWLLNTDSKGIDVWRQVKKPAAPVGDAKPIEPATAAPFRGYIQPKNNAPSNAKYFVVLMEDETTGIDDLQQDKAQNGAQRIYTLDGRYVGTSFDTLPSGIYVIKGKKIAK